MKLRLFSYIVAALLAAGPAQAQSQLLLGAGKPSGAAPPTGCNAFLPANFATSALYISWTTADGLGSFGMACLNGTTAVAASTLGTISGTGSVSSAGLSVTNGFFQFSNLTWLSQNTGTFYTNQLITAYSGATVILLQADDGTSNNFIGIRQASGTRVPTGFDFVGGVSQGLASSAATTNGTPYKVAYSYAAGTQIIYLNGTTTATTAGASVPASLTASSIGSSAVGTQTFTGVITETAFFSTALNAGTSPTLQAITQ